MSGWKYYQHAMLSDCLPHESPDLDVFMDKHIWKKGPWKRALFAKYTDAWDCSEDTGWYWCLKDTPFDLSQLKKKYRYEINKGVKNFNVRIINPLEFSDELYDVTIDAFESYPKIYRNIPSKATFVKSLPTWKKPTFAAFSNGELVGYITTVERANVIYYSGQCVKKLYEKQFASHALIYGMLDYYKEKLKSGYYIVDGERNINHITNHQDFLVKKFGFRRAYCQLNIAYRPGIKTVVKCIYPFRHILKKLDYFSSIIHKINGVMILEEVRKQHNSK